MASPLLEKTQAPGNFVPMLDSDKEITASVAKIQKFYDLLRIFTSYSYSTVYRSCEVIKDNPEFNSLFSKSAPCSPQDYDKYIAYDSIAFTLSSLEKFSNSPNAIANGLAALNRVDVTASDYQELHEIYLQVLKSLISKSTELRKIETGATQFRFIKINDTLIMIRSSELLHVE